MIEKQTNRYQYVSPLRDVVCYPVPCSLLQIKTTRLSLAPRSLLQIKKQNPNAGAPLFVVCYK